jgi:hypothetical protein
MIEPYRRAQIKTRQPQGYCCQSRKIFKKFKAGKISRTITRASLKSFPAKTLPAALISYIFNIPRANATSRARHGDKKQKK